MKFPHTYETRGDSVRRCRKTSSQLPRTPAAGFGATATKKALGSSLSRPKNGRPAAEVARPSLDELRRRMRAVRVAQRDGVELACLEVGCSRASLYRWRTAFETG